jgi:hypothetical protein
MFPRVVECLSIVGRSKQAGSKPENEVLPILQKQPGLVDFSYAFRQDSPRKGRASVSSLRWKMRSNITASNRTRSSKS